MSIKIVHATKERVRVKTKMGLESLEAEVTEMDGVLFTSVNSLCHSLIIRFDNSVVSLSELSAKILQHTTEVKHAA